MDKILIEGLQLRALIGVYDWERTQTQRLIADVELQTDLSEPGDSDKVADTVDYAKVAKCIEQIVNQSEFELLEALSYAIIRELFKRFPIHVVTLKLSKPDILEGADNVAVMLTRTAAEV